MSRSPIWSRTRPGCTRRRRWPPRRWPGSRSGSSGPLDDLRALVSGRPVVAEGWGLRPELVVPLTGEPGRMVVMVPTDRFREYQIRTLARATRVSHGVSDPQRAWRNRLARDRLLAADVVASARQLGVRVIEVDGSGDAEAIADLVGDHFRRYLSG